MVSDEEFHKELDNFVRDKLKRLIQDNPRYFSEKLNAGDILKYMQKMPSEAQERIERVADRDGNMKAVDKLINEMVRYGQFALSFLQGLKETHHRSIARELISDLNIDLFGAHTHSQFLHSLRDLPETQSPPPPYDDAVEDMILADQEAKYRSCASRGGNWNSERSYLHDSSDITYATNDDSTLVNDNAQEMNIVPSTSTRDDNIPASDNQLNGHLGYGGFNRTGINDDQPSNSLGSPPLPSSIVQKPVETNSTDHHAESRSNSNFNSSSGCINPSVSKGRHFFQTASFPGEISDISESEMCISDPETESETSPKELISRRTGATKQNMQNDQEESSYSNCEECETVVRREENPVPDNMEKPVDDCDLSSSSEVNSINNSNRISDSDVIYRGWSLVVLFFVTASLIAGVKNRL